MKESDFHSDGENRLSIKFAFPGSAHYRASTAAKLKFPINIECLPRNEEASMLVARLSKCKREQYGS
jgi:hypothetical protein